MSLIGTSNLVKKVRFRRAIVPVAALVSQAVTMGVIVAILAGEPRRLQGAYEDDGALGPGAPDPSVAAYPSVARTNWNIPQA
jgi:hypothetical protein